MVCGSCIDGWRKLFLARGRQIVGLLSRRVLSRRALSPGRTQIFSLGGLLFCRFLFARYVTRVPEYDLVLSHDEQRYHQSPGFNASDYPGFITSIFHYPRRSILRANEYTAAINSKSRPIGVTRTWFSNPDDVNEV